MNHPSRPLGLSRNLLQRKCSRALFLNPRQFNRGWKNERHFAARSIRHGFFTRKIAYNQTIAVKKTLTNI